MDQLEFEFANVKEEPLRPRASIHKNGKLGFNSDAAEFMDLESGNTFSVGVGQEGVVSKIVLLPCEEHDPDESKIDVARAGDYYYLNLRNFFDLREVSYDEYRIRYDIKRADYEDRVAYVLEGREDNPPRE